MWPWGGCWLQDEACQVSVFKGFKGFKRLEGFKGLRAGKRQALDAHKKPLMCGLGVPVGCRMKHAKGIV